MVVVSSFIDATRLADRKKPYTDDKTERERKRMLRYMHKRTEIVEKELECLDGSGNEIDRDGDGYGCMDCNDEVPEIHPGATEQCNQIDDDCSGLADDSAQCPCPSHDIAGQVFHFCDLPMTWVEAVDYCAAQKLELARIDSVEQSRAVYRQARKYNKDRWWIGSGRSRGRGYVRVARRRAGSLHALGSRRARQRRLQSGLRRSQRRRRRPLARHALRPDAALHLSATPRSSSKCL